MSLLVKSSRENKRENLNDSIKTEIVQLYQQGISSNDIALKFGLNRTTIPKVIKRELGLESLHPFKGNENYFNKIDSHEKAYFLGFIAADGCIVDHSNTGRIDELAINIHEKDSIILETLTAELERETPLYKIPSKNQVSIRLTSQVLCDDLKSYGLGYRKSLTLPNIYQNIPLEFRGSFTLGYFDGDGWISPNKTPHSPRDKIYNHATVGFCGTRDFLHGIASTANLQSYAFKFSPGTSSGSVNGIFTLTFASSAEINRIYHFMYSDCSIFLKRKHDRFLPYLKEPLLI